MKSARGLVLVGLASLILTSLLAEVSTRLWVREIEPTQLTWYDESVQLRMEELAAAPRDVDVLFVGTSIAWQGFVPSNFTRSHPDSLRAYNAGINGGVPVVVEPWLDIIVPETSPELVVWGLSSLDFASSFGDAAEDAWNDALSTRQGWLPSVDRFLTEQSALLEWRRTIVKPSTWAEGDERRAAEAGFEMALSNLGPDGERFDFDINFSDLRAAVQQARLADMASDLNDIAAVLRAGTDLQEQGIEVVLVKMPITDQLVDLHPMGAADVQRIHSVIDEIGVSLGARVIDMSDGFDDTQFVDLTHLDQAAARSLSERFAQALAEARS